MHEYICIKDIDTAPDCIVVLNLFYLSVNRSHPQYVVEVSNVS